MTRWSADIGLLSLFMLAVNEMVYDFWTDLLKVPNHVPFLSIFSVRTCPCPLEAEVRNRLLSPIRLQKWVCSLSPLSPGCLPLPLSLTYSLSFSLSLAFFSLCLCLSFLFQKLAACVIQASSYGTTTDHISLLLDCVPPLLSLPSFPSISSTHTLTGSSPTAGLHSMQESGSHVTPSLPPTFTSAENWPTWQHHT